MMRDWPRWLRTISLAAVFAASSSPLCAEPPNPTLDTIFPAGSAAGNVVTVELAGKSLTGLKTLHTSIPRAHCEVRDAAHCELSIPADTPPGLYDVWAVGEHGVTSPRTFAVGRLAEIVESAAVNDHPSTAAACSIDAAINGRIEQPGDVDFFRFEAKQGRRIILECLAERIDSRLRAVLEIFDAGGQRLAVNRGYFGIDPLIDFHVPRDGIYFVKLSDLVYSGGAEHVYRLEIDTGPRVAFALPNAIARGRANPIRVFGWNLSPGAGHKPEEFDAVDVTIDGNAGQPMWPLPVRLRSHQLPFLGMAYRYPGAQSSLLLAVTEDAVFLDEGGNHSPDSAQRVSVPCDVSGSLSAGDERDWFAFDAQRGEAFHFDVLSQRLGAPTDLHLSVWNAAGDKQLADWSDEPVHLGGVAFPTGHLDPSGRWTAPDAGRYILLIRNLNGGLSEDPRRIYRLSLRREDPDVQLIALPKSQAPIGWNLCKGGRFAFDILALRQRGMNDSIRISALDLPAGIECPDSMLGPGVDRGTMVISAEQSVAGQLFSLKLQGDSERIGTRPVRAGMVIRAGSPQGWSRFSSEIPVAVVGEAPVRVTAAIQDQLDHHLYGPLKLRYFPGSVVDIGVTMDQRQSDHRPAARVRGIGVPPAIANQTSEISAGSRSGVISFYLPPTLSPGEYSFVIQAETTVPTADGKTEAVTVNSNSVTFAVEPAGFLVEVDPFAPRRVQRGETFEIKYATPRTNGFIGKIHTELASPGLVTNVPGLRGRGVTFVGQSDQGSIQVVVNDDAPFGPVPFLRLFGVGIWEDQPAYFGAAWLPLEIVEAKP